MTQDKTPLDMEYETEDISPSNVAIVPILRSGLGMVDCTTIHIDHFWSSS